MKHFIVFSFWCQDEIDIFNTLSGKWKSFANEEVDYEFILLARSDYKDDLNVLKEKFSKIKPCQVLRCRSPIASTNRKNINSTNMFWEVAEYICDKKENDKGFFLWFEADMIPCNTNWLKKIEEEWTDKNVELMGYHVTKEKLGTLTCKEHINGGACYSKQIFNLVNQEKIRMKAPWDVHLMNELIKEGHFFVDSQLWDFRMNKYCKPIREDEPFVEGKAIIHGIKDPKKYEKFLDDLVNLSKKQSKAYK